MKKKRRRVKGGTVWKSGDRNFSDPRYLTWRRMVRERDGYKCRKCGWTPTQKQKFTSLVCHHIRRWADQPTLRFAVGNGITLCKKCHKVVTGNEDAYAPLFLMLAYQSAVKERANANKEATE
jgi:hypothetical protein